MKKSTGKIIIILIGWTLYSGILSVLKITNNKKGICRMRLLFLYSWGYLCPSSKKITFRRTIYWFQRFGFNKIPQEGFLIPLNYDLREGIGG